MSNDTRLITGKFLRTMKTGAMATEAGMRHLNYLGQRFFVGDAEKYREAHESELGKVFFRGLSQMRGTALKAAQILSQETGVLPEGIRRELAKSCYQVPPINKALVRKVFVQEFGQSPGQLFKTFELDAFAAASLGQVHRAESPDGDLLAVKVQYPGIAESIDSDLEIFSFLINSLATATNLTPNRGIIDEALDEIARCLRDEVNYVKEAENTQWFSEHLDVPGISVPRVFKQYSSSIIFAGEYFEGRHLDAWLAENPDQEERNRLGQMIFDCFLHCTFELEALHADPHTGNYLFLNDGGLALLDFGCIKHLSDGFSGKIRNMINALLAGDDNLILQAYQVLQVLSPELSVQEYRKFVYEGLAPLQERLMAPFKVTEYDFRLLQPVPKMESEQYKRGVKYFHGMSRNQLYFDRTYIGVYQLLKKMGAVVRTENRWVKSPCPA